MSDEEKELIKDFIEENWTFFVHYLEDNGFDIQAAEDKAIELVDELEQA